MIFVTVGTHEQPFDRLVKKVDDLRGKNLIMEDVIIQTGFSTYEPRQCQWKRFFPYCEMVEHINNARIIITHGGPSSFIMPLQVGKIPVVVPRQKVFNEHVNDHQINFCKEVANRKRNIILIEDIEQLDNVIATYNDLISGMKCMQDSNNERFCKEFEKIIDEIMK